MQTKKKIIFIRGDYNACSYYRMVLPYKALEAKGYDVNIEPTYDEFVSSDILVFQRQKNEAALNEIIAWKKKGKKIIIDYDDNFFALESHNPANKSYTTGALEILKKATSVADAITVSVKPLAEKYNEYNSNIHILPNSIDEDAFSLIKKNRERATIGWQGGHSHLEDLKSIRSAINELRIKIDFDFILAGYNPGNFFNDSIYRGWMPFSDDLNHHLLFSDFDIGLCPLTDSPFNDSKSDVKFLEYSSLEIPTIASKSLPYITIDHGVTGYLARNLSDWKKYIADLISNKQKRRKIGTAAKEYVVTERTIQINIWRWEEVLNNI